MKKILLAFSCLLFSGIVFSQTPADALDFDGTNDYVLLPTSLPVVGTNDCTFEAWVYPKLSATTALQMILAKDQYADANSQLRLAYVNGSFKFSMSDINGGNIINIIAPPSPINNWYHVAAVRQGTVITLYVNGAVATTTTSPILMNNNNPAHPWMIGCRQFTGTATTTDHLNGTVDELRIWNVARTKCQINTYMHCEIPSNATGLVANYHFNHGVASGANSTVTTLTDYSGNSYAGTLTNIALTGTNSNWVSPGGVTAGSVTPLPPINLGVTASSSIICSGATTTLTGTGANTYTWAGGGAISIVVSPSVTTNYTLSGTNTLTACSNTVVTSVSVMPTPTITVNSGSLCSNYSYTITPSGASTYTYSGGSAIVSPTYNTSYIVSGTAPNGCVNQTTCNITVQASPNLTTLASQTAVCAGQAVQINVLGAVSYSWNGVASASNLTVTPLTNTFYVVTGAGANLCESTKTLNIQVYALPSISITPSRTLFCVGEKIKLSGGGAASYTWTTQGLITPSIQVNPTTTTNYILSGSNANNCVNSTTFQLVVSPCTGIDQNQTGSYKVSIFPNPNTGAFSVRSETEIQINIINEIGQHIKTLSLNEQNNYTVTLSELTAGIYFVLDSNGHSSVKEKVIVTQ